MDNIKRTVVVTDTKGRRGLRSQLIEDCRLLGKSALTIAADWQLPAPSHGSLFSSLSDRLMPPPLNPQGPADPRKGGGTVGGGFEPFGEHTVNASWVAVQELKKLGLGSEVDLHVLEVPVEYQKVQSLVPSLWKQYRPLLVVHVGVSGMATTVTLEKCGRNHGYKGLDNRSFRPDSQCCVVGGPDCIDSVIDMESVCKRVTASGLGVAVSVSKDAGRYLCDFTYYTSLYLSHGRSAFVHVPPLGKPYSREDLGRALQAIVREMLELLDQAEEKIHCLQHFH